MQLRLTLFLLAIALPAFADVSQRPANMSTDPTWVWNWSGSTFGPRGAATIPGITSYGMTVQTLGTPSPSCTVIGTAGAATWQYKVSAVAGGLETLPVSCQTTTGPTTLTATNYVRISWAAVSGANAYRVYRNVGGTYNRLAEVYVALCNDTGAVTPDVTKHPQTADQTGVISGASITGAAATAAGLQTTGSTFSWVTDHWATPDYIEADVTGTLTGNADTATEAGKLGHTITGIPVLSSGTPSAVTWPTGVLQGANSTATPTAATFPSGILKGGGVAGAVPSAATGADVAGLLTGTAITDLGATTIKGADDSSGTKSLILKNSSNAEKFYVTNQGVVTTSSDITSSTRVVAPYFSTTNSNLSKVTMGSTGVESSTATAANVALTVTNSNATPTAHLLDLKKTSTIVASVDIDGNLVTSGTVTASNLPNIVAHVSLTSQNASIAKTSIIAPTTGLYRVGWNIYTITSGTAGTATGTLYWSHGNITSAGTSACNLAVAGAETANYYQYHCVAGTDISYSVTNSGSTGIWGMDIVVERIP